MKLIHTYVLGAHRTSDNFDIISITTAVFHKKMKKDCFLREFNALSLKYFFKLTMVFTFYLFLSDFRIKKSAIMMLSQIMSCRSGHENGARKLIGSPGYK